ncbi:hypothetical protein BDV93DRAFT_519971 [Ceratobasidium sp. AG-I]|nr:hypothetical protein BDV93DRAFT_519971 [Ceratobasidium sp. AG-I]
MPRVSLLPDLVRSIAEHLYGDTYTLASLSLLDNQSFALVIPLIYGVVRLFTIQSIHQFCDAIIHSERNLGLYPTSIHFGSEYMIRKQLHQIIEPIRGALRRTPNLTELVLGMDGPGLIDLYQHLHLHPPPFSLRRLECCFIPDYLLPFLSLQPSIHTLKMKPRLSQGSAYIHTPPASSVLPRLKSITATALTIHNLLPGRPISHVDSCTIIYGDIAERFCECLGESTALGGVESVSVGVPWRGFWTNASDIITRLTEVCGANLGVLTLRVAMPIHVAKLLGDPVPIEELAALLSGFSKLKHVQFSSIRDFRCTGAVEGLGKAGTLTSWKKHCASLRRVILFGVDLR